MPSSFPQIDPALVTSLGSGSERALEQIFRTLYPALLERAKERLKDEPAAAPRLVAAAVRELWEERAGFHSGAEIEGFLNEELRHRATAVRARMATVHRFEKAEGVSTHTAAAPPSADQLWEEIAAALHAPVVDAATAAHKRREHAKHDAAEHIAQMGAKRSWRGPAIAIGTLSVIAVVAMWWAGRASKESVLVQLLAEADSQAIVTRAGQLGSLALSDGTAARLGPDSRLVVVPEFGRRYRTVSLIGTGAFTVSADGAMPFEVRSGDAAATMTSGTLSLRSYADESLRLIRAGDGPAEVRTSAAHRSLAAGEAVVIAADGTIRDATADEASAAFAWTEGRLTMLDVSVGDAIKGVWRWYGTALTLADSALGERRLSLEAPLTSSQAAIAAIESGANLRFAWVGNKMVLSDVSVARARR